MRPRPNAVIVDASPPLVRLTTISGSERVAEFTVTALEASHLIAQLQLALAKAVAIRHADRDPSLSAAAE